MSAAVDMVAHQRSLSQWMTPVDVAERVLRAADWSGDRPQQILEPACGSGNLLAALERVFGSAEYHVTAYDIDPRFGRVGDYLKKSAPPKAYDLALMNPPYEQQRDVAFISKAMNESTRVIAFVRAAFLHNKGSSVVLEREGWSLNHIWPLGRVRFEGPASGTPRHDFVAIDLWREPGLTTTWGW